MKRMVVAVLAGLYPARWKREYGAEFRDVLAQRTLTPAAVLDTLLNAAVQQVRRGEPWLIVGFPLLLHYTGTIAWNILYPAPYVRDSFEGGGLVAAALAFLLPLGVGYWTVWRDPAQGRGGQAAMKNALFITWPMCALAILYGLGILKILVLGPGDAPTTFHEHGFAYTIYDHKRRDIFGAYLFALPLVQVPLVGLIGWLGGLAARGQLRLRRQAGKPSGIGS